MWKEGGGSKYWRPATPPGGLKYFGGLPALGTPLLPGTSSNILPVVLFPMVLGYFRFPVAGLFFVLCLSVGWHPFWNRGGGVKHGERI